MSYARCVEKVTEERHDRRLPGVSQPSSGDAEDETGCGRPGIVPGGSVGVLEIEASDGEVRPIGPGTVLLAEDTTGKGHRNRVTSTSELQMVFITLPDEQGS